MRLSGQGMGNGPNFGVENVLRRTQGGSVEIAGSCSWTNNKQAFLAVRKEPVWDGDNTLPTEQED